mgnify:CR=1 FL=1
MEPKSDLRFALGLRFEVDLLVPEFGQDVKTLDEYITVWQTRLTDQGIDTTTFAESKDIPAPPGYPAYSFNLASGRQIALVRQLNEDMIEMISLVFLKDFETLYPQNRAMMEKIIASTKLNVS